MKKTKKKLLILLQNNPIGSFEHIRTHFKKQ